MRPGNSDECGDGIGIDDGLTDDRRESIAAKASQTMTAGGGTTAARVALPTARSRYVERTGASRPVRPAPRGADQIRLNTRVPLVPPKPKPLETVTSTFFSRAVLGT